MLTRHHQIALIDPDSDGVLVVDGALPRHPDRWPSFAELALEVGAPGAWAAGPPIDSVAVPGLAGAWEEWCSGYAGDGRAAWFYRAQPEGARWELATVVGEILDKLAEVRDGAS